jgi:hypothetical protein
VSEYLKSVGWFSWFVVQNPNPNPNPNLVLKKRVGLVVQSTSKVEVVTTLILVLIRSSQL